MAPMLREETFDPDSCDVAEGSTAPGRRRLLRFGFATPNTGAGDLVVGRPELRPELFEFDPCHRHHHFREYADYRLWTPRGFARWDELRRADTASTAADILAEHPELRRHLVVGEKRGFCMIDVLQYDQLTPAKYASCHAFQGISVGWADYYDHWLPGQYIDVTSVRPSRYVLEAEVNAERVFEELDYSDNRAWLTISLLS